MANDDIKEPTFIEHETGDTSQPVSVIVSDAMISGKAFRDASVEKLIDSKDALDSLAMKGKPTDPKELN